MGLNLPRHRLDDFDAWAQAKLKFLAKILKLDLQIIISQITQIVSLIFWYKSDSISHLKNKNCTKIVKFMAIENNMIRCTQYLTNEANLILYYQNFIFILKMQFLKINPVLKKNLSLKSFCKCMYSKTNKKTQNL